MKIVLLLILLSVSECSSRSVVGLVGQNVTLPCRYDTKTKGVCSMCWGQGDIPASGCNKELISTNGLTVVGETSRFQLLGRLDEGDVSLTILNLTESDTGRYGCRVHITGWFNDVKHHVDLTVQTAAQTTSETSGYTGTATEPTHTYTTGSAAQTTRETTTRMTAEPTDIYTAGLLTTTESTRAEQPEHSMTLMVLLGLEALLASALILINTRRWKLLNKMPQHVSSTVCFSLTPPTLRESAMKNIYQIDGGQYTIVECNLNLQPWDSDN